MNRQPHPTRASRTRRFTTGALSAIVLAVFLLLPAFLAAGPQRASAEPLNGAGLVVQFDDGSVLYAYVQFAEEEISSEELLYRSGLDVVVTPYGGLGIAVCSINGNGCPADNCFCASYTNPAYFWHFYALVSGSWMVQPFGPSSRTIGDGDVDGWSWNAGDHALPTTDIDSIALLNGIDRNAPEPTPTATLAPPTETPTPTATATATATNTVAAEPTATLTPTSTTTSTATTPTGTTPTATTATAATATPTPATTGTAAVTATTTGTATATSADAVTPDASPERASPTQTATAADDTSGTGAPGGVSGSTPSPSLTLEARATTAAVIVDPSGTVTPVTVREVDDDFDWQPVLLFGGAIVVVGAVGGFAWYRRSQMAHADDFDAA